MELSALNLNILITISRLKNYNFLIYKKHVLYSFNIELEKNFISSQKLESTTIKNINFRSIKINHCWNIKQSTNYTLEFYKKFNFLIHKCNELFTDNDFLYVLKADRGGFLCLYLGFKGYVLSQNLYFQHFNLLPQGNKIYIFGKIEIYAMKLYSNDKDFIIDQDDSLNIKSFNFNIKKKSAFFYFYFCFIQEDENYIIEDYFFLRTLYNLLYNNRFFYFPKRKRFKKNIYEKI